MTRVTIFPVPSPDEGAYIALSGNQQFFGNTAGEALDALTGQLKPSQTSTVIIVQNMQPDQFFSTDEWGTLHALMTEWRAASAQGTSLPTSDQRELFASAERTKKMIRGVLQ